MAKKMSQEECFAKLHEAIDAQRSNPGGLMPVLHEAQHLFGAVSLDVQKVISRELSIPLAEIYGVVTFYSQFTLEPNGEYVIGVCMGTAGPGVTHLVPAVAAANADSIPVLVIGAQIARMFDDTGILQGGLDQITLMKPITKLQISVEEPYEIPFAVQRCIKAALSGRPSPVFLELRETALVRDVTEKDIANRICDDSHKEIRAWKIAYKEKENSIIKYEDTFENILNKPENELTIAEEKFLSYKY